VEGDYFAGVKITGLPTAGSLKFQGSPVALDQVIDKANIYAGDLTFVPAPNANGLGYASFQFAVKDRGGTENGGHDTDQTPNAITFDVTPVNDPPWSVDKTINVRGEYALCTADFFFSDHSDNPPDAFAAVKVTGLPTAGSLKYTSPDGHESNVTLNQVISTADIDAGKLTFTPPPNANGHELASFQYAVKDDGGTQNGGKDTDETPDTIYFTVTPVNDPPSGTDNTLVIMVAAQKDQERILKASDFGFNDLRDGDHLKSVYITDVQGDQQCELWHTVSGGFPYKVGPGAEVSKADIDAGRVVVLTSEASGSLSIVFKVKDDGGTANGGKDTALTPNTIFVKWVPIVPVADNQTTTVTFVSGSSGDFPRILVTGTYPIDVSSDVVKFDFSGNWYLSHGYLKDDCGPVFRISVGKYGQYLSYHPYASGSENGVDVLDFTMSTTDLRTQWPGWLGLHAHTSARDNTMQPADDIDTSWNDYVISGNRIAEKLRDDLEDYVGNMWTEFVPEQVQIGWGLVSAGFSLANAIETGAWEDYVDAGLEIAEGIASGAGLIMEIAGVSCVAIPVAGGVIGALALGWQVYQWVDELVTWMVDSYNIKVPEDTISVKLADVNNDGWPDIIAGITNLEPKFHDWIATPHKYNKVFLNDHGKNFTFWGNLEDSRLETTCLEVGDLNNDHWPDVVVGTDEDGVRVYWNKTLWEDGEICYDADNRIGCRDFVSVVVEVKTDR